MAFVEFNKDFDDRLKQMAVRAVKEQNGNHCYYCGAEVEDMSGVGESQLPVCSFNHRTDIIKCRYFFGCHVFIVQA